MSVVLYRYDASPFSVKIDNALLLKQIPHKRVNVSPVLPRPEITDLLGLGYRRIPILAIGNDIYCDTSLICSALERRFPQSAGYATLFPKKTTGANADTGLIKAFCRHYADSALFNLAPVLVDWGKQPQILIKDRSALLGAPLAVDAMAASRDKYISILSSHLSLVEEQVTDGRQWLFDTETPSVADVSVSFVFNWVKGMKNTNALFDSTRFPHAAQWLSRLNLYLTNVKNELPAPEITSGTEAAKIIAEAPFESYEVVGFSYIEGSRLDLQVGDVVSITPDDTGRNFPTVGRLVALNAEEFVVEIRGQSGIYRCHFPTIGFTATKVTSKL